MDVKPMNPKGDEDFLGPSGHPGLSVRGCVGDQKIHASAETSDADDVCDMRLDAQVPIRMDMLLVRRGMLLWNYFCPFE